MMKRLTMALLLATTSVFATDVPPTDVPPTVSGHKYSVKANGGYPITVIYWTPPDSPLWTCTYIRQGNSGGPACYPKKTPAVTMK